MYNIYFCTNCFIHGVDISSFFFLKYIRAWILIPISFSFIYYNIIICMFNFLSPVMYCDKGVTWYINQVTIWWRRHLLCKGDVWWSQTLRAFTWYVIQTCLLTVLIVVNILRKLFSIYIIWSINIYKMVSLGPIVSALYFCIRLFLDRNDIINIIDAHYSRFFLHY